MQIDKKLGMLSAVLMLLMVVGSGASRGDTVHATGGDRVFDTKIDDVIYRIHVFTNQIPSGFIVKTGGEIDYLVVGGGGDGGGTDSTRDGGDGGSGIVVIRYVFYPGTVIVVR